MNILLTIKTFGGAGRASSNVRNCLISQGQAVPKIHTFSHPQHVGKINRSSFVPCGAPKFHFAGLVARTKCVGNVSGAASR